MGRLKIVFLKFKKKNTRIPESREVANYSKSEDFQIMQLSLRVANYSKSEDQNVQGDQKVLPI